MLRNKNLNGKKLVPPIICGLKQLLRIELASVNLNGEFPRVLYNCTELEILDLSWNKLHGPLPSDLHRMSSLTCLDLSGNFFSGAIPAAVAQLSKLRELLLGRNNLEGSIIPEIGNLSNLEILDLSYMEKSEPSPVPEELDFGLAKVVSQHGDHHTEIASAVAGTFGYIAPGKEPVNKDEHMNLAQWAWKHCEEGNPIVDVLDEEIMEPVVLKAMTAVFKLGLMCTNKLASSRPSMKEVLQTLLLFDY
ncbi:hypothetical protein HAX54_050632 [Datura stramonium]|uniref:Uncharacterized protein n=1 Tax=Datura stramonium TaxID=4076 RepID=A0ABS8SXD9_DATST|nr:hypothetical protein [Datura stramonium]